MSVVPAIVLAAVPSTDYKLGQEEWTVDIVAYDELRFMIGTSIVVQKKIAVEVPVTSELQEPQTFDEFWTRELAAFLGDVSYLQAKFPKEVEMLRFTLYHDRVTPPHKKVAQALLDLMGKWMQSCNDDNHCIAPPSTSMLADPEFRKIMANLAERGVATRE